ncbi:MAG: adenylate/guanylate cyclase domain-containing protein [Methylococcales bacterium]|nr:adenylate/guanylate cyclase domain-containing protein [Methylococcales bacterium]
MQNTFKKWLRRPLVSCFLLGLLSAIVITSVQYAGILQGAELRAFDQLLLKRPDIEIDNRIVIIGETEPDIRRYGHPLSDKVLADALQKIETAGARVIGVDKYRDVAVKPGTDELKNILQKYGNIIWIFFAGNSKQEFIPAPEVLANNPERMGFNDLVEDSDGVSRRGLLFLDIDGNSYYAFPLLLALHYLAAENIHAQGDEQGNLSLNGVSLPPIDSNFGAYSSADTGGYQIMLNYPSLPQSFKFFTLSDLLDNKISTDMLKDKIVLIGGTAPSLQDYRLLPNGIKRFGVEYHAYFVSQLLNTAIKQNQPLHAWSNYSEYLWLLILCLAGAFTGFRRGSLPRLLALIVGEFIFLFVWNIAFLNEGWWAPLIAPMLGWASSLALSVLYFSSQERAERRQLMQLFASHVSPEVAKRLWNAREQFFSEGGVRPDTLTATVLFTDIANFTTIAENMEPLILMKWLNEYMGEMSNIVINHNGMVNKYIGDAMMAIFGVPVKRETDSEIEIDAQHAVQCAVKFNRQLRELNQQWQAQGLPQITMRTGIYTGSLVAGSFGGVVRMEYTVIGDTVNTASRLESFDKSVARPNDEHPCRILIGETTYHHVAHLYETRIVGECQLKGRNEYSKIYQILTR